MDLQLEGKSALVSGSTAGIGLAVALALAKEGAAVTVNGRTRQRVDAAVELIAKAAPKAQVMGVAADLAKPEGTRALLTELPAVDILVNNLGIYRAVAFQDISDDQWQEMLSVNVISAARLTRAYLPGMLARNWGRVMFISSESGINIPVEMIHYGVSKTAMLALSRGLAQTTAGTGVTVNAVLPGPTRSEGVAGFLKEMAANRGGDQEAVERDFFTNIRPTSLLKRFAEPEEVANMVAYVASPRSAATNGAALRVDGGVVNMPF
jgi:NAD(P)-dependent dehydrogenase (short-subunit alcohol dehydrogenase family)